MSAADRKSFRQVLKQARSGDPYFMVEAGRRFRDGEGVKRNPFKAWLWFEKGFRKGLPIGGVMSELLWDGLSEGEKSRLNLAIKLYGKHDVIGWVLLAVVWAAILVNAFVYLSKLC